MTVDGTVALSGLFDRVDRVNMMISKDVLVMPWLFNEAGDTVNG